MSRQPSQLPPFPGIAEANQDASQTPLPSQPPDPSARIPFTTSPGWEADGYRSDGPNTPQPGSETAPVDTSPNVDKHAEGHAADLPDYTANMVTASDAQTEAWEAAYAYGRAQQSLMDTDQANRAAQELMNRFGHTLDDTERSILGEFFMAGHEGVGADQGDGVVNQPAPDSGWSGE